MTKRVIGILLIGLLAWATAMATEEEEVQNLLSDAPIQKFRLPGFDDNGKRSWLLQGDEAIIISPQEIQVVAMVLRTFTKADPLHAQTTIQSPSALIYPEQSMAWGQDIITINDRFDAYSIVGKDWLWQGQAQKITINQDARVTFKESLGSILE